MLSVRTASGVSGVHTVFAPGRRRLVSAAIQQAFPDQRLDAVIEQILRRETDPYSVVEKIIQGLRFERFPS